MIECNMEDRNVLQPLDIHQLLLPYIEWLLYDHQVLIFLFIVVVCYTSNWELFQSSYPHKRTNIHEGQLSLCYWRAFLLSRSSKRKLAQHNGIFYLRGFHSCSYLQTLLVYEMQTFGNKCGENYQGMDCKCNTTYYNILQCLTRSIKSQR